MPKYLIERQASGIGNLSERGLQALSLKSNRVLEELGPKDPVAPQLRQRRPAMLRLHLAQRGHDPRARGARPVPAHTHHGGQDHN